MPRPRQLRLPRSADAETLAEIIAPGEVNTALIEDLRLAKARTDDPAEAIDLAIRELVRRAPTRPPHRIPRIEGASIAYVLVPPPEELTAAEPLRYGDHLVPRYSAWRSVEPAEQRVLIAAGNAALAKLASARFSVQLTPGEGREDSIRAASQLFASVLRGAQVGQFYEVQPRRRAIRTPPGHVPQPVEGALLGFLDQLQTEDVLDTNKARTLAAAVGHRPHEPASWSLPQTTRGHGASDAKRSATLGRLGQRLLAGELPQWWVESDVLDGGGNALEEALGSGTFSRAGKHLTFPVGPQTEGDDSETPDEPPETHPKPPEIPPVPPEIPVLRTPMAWPISFSISDLHLGQGELRGKFDPADEVYPELEKAYVAAISGWSKEVKQHRSRHGSKQPAILVLNGDILDFWAADLRDAAGPGNQFQPDATLVRGFPNPADSRFELTTADARGRMNRILKAHTAFIDSVTNWIEEDLLNFCVYVCGNHDDHLARFGLGGELAARLHPSRAAFAAQTFEIPRMVCFYEHGHRDDKFNNCDGRLGYATSLGELLCMLMVNPVERGGLSALTAAEEQVRGLGGTTGLDMDDFNSVESAYRHLTSCRNVNPAIYEKWMGQIDNLANELDMEAVPDRAAFALDAKPHEDAAKMAEVYDMDYTIESLLSTWLTDDFQDLLVQLLGPLLLTLPKELKGAILESAREGQLERLGFSMTAGSAGLYSNPAWKVHVVGHTHQPRETTPALTGAIVSAQHVNTGTGQDTFTAIDPSGDQDEDERLVPVQCAQGALLRLAMRRHRLYVHVQGIEYRSLQPSPGDGHADVATGFPPNQSRPYNLVRLDS